MVYIKPNMSEAEAFAKAKAISQIITMFQRPGQIEKIDQYKRTVARQKASFEALLKSAMQKQLDGVKHALNMLKSNSESVEGIEEDMKVVQKLFDDVPVLFNALNEVRDENMRHSQYVTAIENHKHIFTMPASVEKTKQWINEGKLLHTHQSLRDLETSRDDLLYELHKLPNQSPHDKGMLKEYFAQVEVLSQLLEKQMKLILSRTLNTVRKDPSVIVTVLRIIEREEKSDEDALKQEKQSGFLPPGRPKRWKKMLFQILEKSVATRIEGTQVEEREDNKHWLIRYLELIRLLILEDLRVVKTLCVPCFPPRYDIMKRYINMYHSSLSIHLQEIIQNGLEGNEYVTILSWINKTYKSKDLLGHPDLNEDTSSVGPLLPIAVMERLEGDYLKNLENNYKEWMQNTLTSEEAEWNSGREIHLDTYTRQPAPVLIFQMITQNLQVTNTMSNTITEKVLGLSLDQVINFGESYRLKIVDFKNRYFSDRKQIPYFTQHMIVIINSCYQFVQINTELNKQYSTIINMDDLSEKFRTVDRRFMELRNETAGYLLQEVTTDLEEHYEKLFTQAWLKTSLPIDTIDITLKDYFNDYNHLVDDNYKFVAVMAKKMVAQRFLTCLLSKRLTMKTYEECRMVADKIDEETKKLSSLFMNLCKTGEENDNPFECIFLLCEVIRSDSDMLSFELHRVVEKYPDITEDHLYRLLNFRGDLSRSDIKDKVTAIEKPVKTFNSIFSMLVFPKLLNF